MDRDEVWRTIDDERASLADLLDELSPQEWEAPSLCAGWRVRDVAAHLTLAQTRTWPALRALVAARGDVNRMIRDTALQQARLPVDHYAPLLRAMVGTRATAPGVSHLDPLIDVLVHGQDITRPLGRYRAMPPEAAAAAATRVCTTGWPLRLWRTPSGVRLSATDVDWSVGEGELVEGPMAALLLLLTGRAAAWPEVTGPGVPALQAQRSR